MSQFDLPAFPMDTLKPFPTDNLPTFAGAAPRDTSADLPESLAHRRRPTTRKMVSTRHVANVVAALAALPERGESLHIVARGNTPLWLFIPRLQELSGAAIRRLTIATLGFGRDFAGWLVDALDAGQVADVAIVAAHYFKSVDGDLFGLLRDQLTTRGHQIAATRCHAKIIVAETDAAAYVFEGSGNLRSCRSIEQVTISCDRDLAQFHAEWIRALIQEAQRHAR